MKSNYPSTQGRRLRVKRLNKMKTGILFCTMEKDVENDILYIQHRSTTGLGLPGKSYTKVKFRSWKRVVSMHQGTIDKREGLDLTKEAKIKLKACNKMHEEGNKL